MNNFAYAARTLRKNIGFSVAVVVLLTLGIGGNVAIFSIVNAVLLRPLPYADPDRLTVLIGNIQRTVVERRGTSLPDYRDWKEQSDSFEGLACMWNLTFAWRGAEERVPIAAEVVGAQYFSLLGITPAMGRDFRAEEETDSSLPPVVMLSYEFWTQRLGSDASVIGKTLTLNSNGHTVVGVMPRGFRGIRDGAQVWVPPASLPPAEQTFIERSTRGLNVLGRLRPRVSVTQAQAEMDRVSRSLEEAYPDTNAQRGVEVAPLVEETFGNVRPALLVLFAAVSLVLFIACANAANLILLRTEARRKEILVRTAVGASRWELLKVILAETLLLSLAGAGLALLVLSWAVDLLLAVSPIGLPSFVNVAPDRNVLVFATGLAFGVALLMAIAPALQLASSDVHEALGRNTLRTTAARSTQRFRNAVVIGEVALSFILLLTAGLLIESFRQLTRVDTGFETSNLLALRLGFDGQSSIKAAAVKEAIEGLPDVTSVALASVIPFSGGGGVFYSAEGEDPRRDPSTAHRAYLNFVSPDYFQTMGIPFRHGRDFNAVEGDQAVIVSEKLAGQFWPGQDTIGKRIRIGRDNPDNPWLNIVGVVGDTKTRGIPENPTSDPELYFTFQVFGGNPAVLIRTQSDPSLLIAPVMNEIKRLDKLAIVSSVSTVEELMRPGTSRSLFLSSVSGVFSGLALMLALAGIYGSMSYTVALRTREIGIRIALGADPRNLRRMVLGRSLVLIAAGLGLGLAGSFVAGRGISTLLFGVSATAPSLFAMTSALMLVTGLGAAYIPARRASRVDPLSALRQE